MVDTFGEALRALREDREWSLAQLATKVRWSKPVIAAIETDRQRPTVAFAAACDQVFGTAPILTTLCGLTGEDDAMRRRALLGTFASAVAFGTFSAHAALAEAIRIDLAQGAGVSEDWQAVVADYQHRLVVTPDRRFGDDLLAAMLSARQQVSEHRDPFALQASAHLGLLYGLWMGNLGNVATAHNHLRTAAIIAERTGDRDTRAYVAARTAAAGPYQGLPASTTQRHIAQALALAGNTATTGALEAHAATVQLAALRGDLPAGRTAVAAMWHVADRLPAPAVGPSPAQRTVSFAAYLEGRLGDLAAAQRARRHADQLLAGLPQWHAEAALYHALALIRHGDLTGGLAEALGAARSLRYPARVIRLGVDDVLRALPPGYTSDELRQHATTGPKPWELISA